VSKTVFNAACVCNLRHPAKAVLKEMAWFADDAGQNIWPSVTTLADRTGLSRRAIQKLLRNLEETGAIRGLGSRLGGRRRTTRYWIDLSWLKRNSERANPLRPFRLHKDAKIENGEHDNAERANGKPQNSERRSPDQNEQENEKNLQIFPQRTEEYQQIGPEPKCASVYEHQRLRQKVRKDARELSMPSPMSAKQLQARRLLLKGQAELLTKTRLP